MLMAPGLEARPDHQRGRRLPRHGGATSAPSRCPARRPADAPAFLGGSNLAISANSENPDLAFELLKILTGEDYQTQFAEIGHDPGAEVAARPGQRRRGGQGPGQGGREQPLRPVQRELGRGRGRQHPARHAASPSPGRRRRRPRPPRADDAIDEPSSTADRPAAGADRYAGRSARPTCPESCADARRTAPRRHSGTAAAGVAAAAPPAARLLPYVLLVPALAALGADARLPARPPGASCRSQEFGLRQQFGAPRRLGRARQLPRRSSATPTSGTVLRRTLVFCAVNVGAHDGARHGWSPCCSSRLGTGMRTAVELGAAAGLGDAGADRHRRLAVDLRHPVRRRQLAAHPARRRLRGPLVAVEPARRSSSWPRSSSSGWASRSSPSRSTPA